MCQDAVKKMPEDREGMDKLDFFNEYMSRLFEEPALTALRDFIDVRYSSIVLTLTLSPNSKP
jgi:hypothetical protein